MDELDNRSYVFIMTAIVKKSVKSWVVMTKVTFVAVAMRLWLFS